MPADHEEGQRLGDRVEAPEVGVAAVEDVERARFDDQRIEERHIGGLAVGDRHEGRDVAPQVEQGVELHRRLGPAEAGPRKQGQTEVDRRRVERVGRLRQVDREGLVGVQPPRPMDQDLREVAVDPPVARLVRIGEGTPRHAASQARVVELRLQRPQARLDVAETLAVRQLGEGQAEELVVAGERPQAALAGVARDAPLERAARDQVHELRKHRASDRHGPVLSAVGQSVKDGPLAYARKSNRYQSSVAVTSGKYVSYRHAPSS